MEGMSAPMPTVRRLRFAAAAIVLFGAGLAHPAAARAEIVPRGATIRIGLTLDAAAFARSVEARYRVELRRVVAADVDRDGDLDVLASTDRELLVWVNDGDGWLTSQAPPGHKPDVSAVPSGNTWREDDGTDRGTIQNDTPSRVSVSRWHVPRDGLTREPELYAAAPAASFIHDTLRPRAPPVPR